MTRAGQPSVSSLAGLTASVLKGVTVERDDVIIKVQACWRLAEHPNTPENERQAALETARRLMAKFQIDEIVLQEKQGTREQIVMRNIRVEEEGRPGRVKEQRIALAHVIGSNMRCKSVIRYLDETADVTTGKRVPAGTFLTVVGYDSDTQMVASLYWGLCMDMIGALMDEKVQTVNYQAEFAAGYVTRIDERLRAINRDVETSSDDEGHSMALVVIDRNKKVADTFSDMFPNLKTVKVQRRTYDPNARARGASKANVADIGQTGVGGGNRGELGS